MEQHELIQQAVKRLQEAGQTRVPCDPVRELIGAEDQETAYRVQQLAAQARLQKGEQVVGKKIGLTSPAVQAQLGVDMPDYGLLFNTMEVQHGHAVAWEDLMQPKAEAEIAFVLGKDLKDSVIGTADVLSAIDYALASIEIVGSRIKNWDIRITDTISDNAAASHFVLGHKPMRLENLDLLGCQMQLHKNGTLASEGTGASCLGSPINAMLWLARTMVKMGTPMLAGDVVLTGALGPMVAVEPGDKLEAEIEGLGKVAVEFATEAQ